MIAIPRSLARYIVRSAITVYAKCRQLFALSRRDGESRGRNRDRREPCGRDRNIRGARNRVIEAVIVTVPAFNAVSIPVLLTVATVVSELCQLTWLVTVCVLLSV